MLKIGFWVRFELFWVDGSVRKQRKPFFDYRVKLSLNWGPFGSVWGRLSRFKLFGWSILVEVCHQARMKLCWSSNLFLFLGKLPALRQEITVKHNCFWGTCLPCDCDWYQPSIYLGELRYFQSVLVGMNLFFRNAEAFWSIYWQKPSNFTKFELFWVCVNWCQPSNCMVLTYFEALTGINRVFCYLVDFEVFCIGINWYQPSNLWIFQGFWDIFGHYLVSIIYFGDFEIFWGINFTNFEIFWSINWCQQSIWVILMYFQVSTI